MELFRNKVAVRGVGYKYDTDISFNNRKYIYTRGVVTAIGEVGVQSDYFVEYYTVFDRLKVGDEVFVKWHHVEAAVKEGLDIIMDYNSIICIIRDELIPINGNVLVSNSKVIAVADDIDIIKTDNGVFRPTYPKVGDYVKGNFMLPLERQYYQEYQDIEYCNVGLIDASWSL